jgi:DNA polymerase-1
VAALQADAQAALHLRAGDASSEALYRIERNGVLIDAPTLRAAEPRAGPAHPGSWSTEAYEIAGQPFNLGSPKQLGEILFDKLGLPW